MDQKAWVPQVHSWLHRISHTLHFINGAENWLPVASIASAAENSHRSMLEEPTAGPSQPERAKDCRELRAMRHWGGGGESLLRLMTDF